MDSLKSVWQSILDEIAKNITSTAYNTWFSDCEPVELGETSLIIQTTSDFKRSVIQGRFGDVIRAALREIFSCEMELVVLTPEEIDTILDPMNLTRPGIPGKELLAGKA